MKMKRNGTLFALCLIGASSAFAQTSTTYSTDTTRTSTTTNTTLSADTTNRSTSSMSTGSTMDNSSNTMSNSSNSMNNTSGTMNSASPATNTNSTYSSSATTTTTSTDSEYGRNSRGQYDKPYKAFAFGIYAGLNSTRFRGEAVNVDAPNGRLGYQLGAFFRFGGRAFFQIGGEYLASSSDFFLPGDGSTVQTIRDRINLQYIHIPAYVGVKLIESDRGISAIRLQVGTEYATPIGVSNNDFNFERGDFRNGTFNLLGNLGFDIGPVMIDLVYHHGIADALREVNNAKRRIAGINVGFKF